MPSRRIKKNAWCRATALARSSLSLRRYTGIDRLGRVSLPHIAIQGRDGHRTVGHTYVAVEDRRINHDSDRRRGTRNSLGPDKSGAGGSPILIILNGIAVCSIQQNEAAQKCRHNTAFNFGPRRTIRVTDVARQSVVMGGTVRFELPGAGQRIGHHVTYKVSGAGDV